MSAITFWSALLVIVLQLFDIHSTNAILRRGGFERNPVMQWLMLIFGDFWVVPKLVIAFGAVYILVRADLAPALVALAIFYLFVVGNNYRVLRDMRRK